MEESPARNQEQPSAEEWLTQVKQAEQRGELLEAYDIAQRGLAQYPDDLWLKHRAVLVLARAGATQMAAQRFREHGLENFDDAQGEIPALGARIAKDQALHSQGGERRERAAKAAALYEAVYRQTGGYYPGINASTLSLIAGQPSNAASLAEQVLAVCRSGDDDPYDRKATEAEAQLVLNRPDAAIEALREAADLHDGDFAAVASTRKQLRLICDIQGIDPAVLAPLSPPTVIHYCGHRVAPEGASGRFPAAAEAEVAARIREALDEAQVGFGYGSLASGADVLFAEALLARGAEINVVLPFAEEEFERISVAPSGGQWRERFRRCLTAATPRIPLIFWA